VRIENSFNKRKEQIANLDKLINRIISEVSTNQEAQKEAAFNLENVKREIENEEKPDKNRIARWLQNAKTSLEVIKLSKETIDIAKSVYASFNLAGLVTSLAAML
jgi:hypothetical protein